MTTTYEREGLTWIDLESPSEEELGSLQEKYSLHPLVVTELRTQSDRQKVDLYENLMYLILQFPTLGHAGASSQPQEIDFLIGKDFLVTVHYEPIDALREAGGQFEVNTILNKGIHEKHAGFVFFSIIQKLYASLEDQLEDIAHGLGGAKDRIFAGQERAMVERLSSINRTLLEFRIAIKSHGNIWDSFEKAGVVFFDKKFSYYLAAISGGYNKIWNMLEGNKEILNDLRQTNDSLLTTKMNETMVHLTMMAFVVFPLTLIAGIFSMQTQQTPVIGTPNDFWKVVAAMFVTALVVFCFFKYRKWL